MCDTYALDHITIPYMKKDKKKFTVYYIKISTNSLNYIIINYFYRDINRI